MKKQLPKNSPLFSLVVPFHNEEGNLEKFFERASQTMSGMGVSWELVFVNDGSSDDSLTEALRLHEQHDEVVVIDLSRNFGKEIALSAGLDHASGDAIIEIDADLEHPPEVIVDLVDKWREGFQIVFSNNQIKMMFRMFFTQIS